MIHGRRLADKRLRRFLERETGAQAIWDQARSVGLIAENEEEMDRIVAFIESAREGVHEGLIYFIEGYGLGPR